MANDATQADPCVRAAPDLDSAALAGRLAALRQADAAVAGWSGTGHAGLALSGGGIRSATLSLGMLQAVAAHGLIGRFDYVSGVSGGGYVSGFFRSLFLPPAQRGPHWQDPGVEPPPGVAEQHRFALAALTSEAADQTVEGPAGTVRNPIWWLRQHSRYLAPNGPSDYASAASYLIRNWIAMLYVFAIAVAGAFAGVTLLLWAFFRAAGLDPLVARVSAFTVPVAATEATPAMVRTIYVSPWFTFAVAAIVAAFCCGLAYWMTENMRSNPQPIGTGRHNDRADSRRRFLLVAVPTAAVALLVGAGVILWDVSSWTRTGWLWLPERRTAGSPATAIIAGGAGFIAIGAGVAIIAYLKAFRRFPNPTAEVRRLLTAWLTSANLAALVFLAAGVCDSLALALRAKLPALSQGGIAPFAPVALLPAGAFVINRLTSLIGGNGGGGIMRFLTAHAGVAMLLAGVLLYGGVAVFVDAVVQALLWRGAAWGPLGLDPRPTVVLLIVLAVLILLTGRSRGFINLSSLHQLYAARLTRAYLGASNLARLALNGDAHGIKESDACDHIEPRAHFTVATTAPIPLALVTLNETIARRSQLIERDRKGVPLVLGPEGISVDRGVAVSWPALARARAEPLSMGQWAAISGAAASSGMGRQTSLGGALTLTFANVRTGYWWDHGGEIEPAGRATLARWLGRRLDTFVFLFDEMTARFSRNWRRVYLSDGGHFENSAAYALLHRRVGVILLCDGGADLTYKFDDLEQLVRKARLDLRGEVEPLPASEVQALAGAGARYFLNADGDGDWHARLDDPARFALLLRARFAGEARTSLIVWLKPRRLPGLAPDVAAYARFNPDFPQQSTGDQFFDEAQWESHRKLGHQMTDLLLRACGPGFLDALRRDSGRPG